MNGAFFMDTEPMTRAEHLGELGAWLATPTAQVPDAQRLGRRLSWLLSGMCGLKQRLQARWPAVRRQLPRDLVIVLLLALLAQGLGLAWVMTDSVHTTAALIFKGAPARRGELVAFAYAGDSLPHYYSAVDAVARVRRWFGLPQAEAGPRRGDGFLKYVWGLPGDRIEVEGRRVFLLTAQGRYDMGLCKPLSKRGDKLEPIAPQVIPAGYFYAWAPHEDALDSRYSLMGLVPVSSVIGRARALW